MLKTYLAPSMRDTKGKGKDKGKGKAKKK